MEQARHWMWTKRKHDFGTRHVLSSSHPSFGDSWEEQAFAEDAAGTLGGCIWPPRSYSCSFCRREFKSAQALGGHMNVHRRDRARLKQSPNSHGELGLPQNHSIQNPRTSLDVHEYSPQICTYLYNRNCDSDQEVLTSPSSPVRVSAPPTNTQSEDKTFAPPFLSSINHEQRKNNMSTAQSWSNLVAEKYFHVSDLKNEDKSSKSLESNCRAKEEYLKADLSVSLNLLVRRTQRTASDAEETPISKRRRIDASSFALFPRSSPTERYHLSHSEVLKSSPSSLEDLDLELRLGDPPKVSKLREVTAYIAQP